MALHWCNFARAAGELGNPELFDRSISAARSLTTAASPDVVAADYALHEVQLRGLTGTGRPDLAVALLDRAPTTTALIPPQWQVMLQVTVGEVLLTRNDRRMAAEAFDRAISVALPHRLPHQIQRVIRATDGGLEDVNVAARSALRHLRVARAVDSQR